MSQTLTIAEDVSFETDRLVLRPLAPDDAASVAAMFSDPAVSRWLANAASPYSEAEAARYIGKTQTQAKAGTAYTFAVLEKASGRFVGLADLDDMADLALAGREYDFGYCFMHEAWGNGYAAEAARALRDWAFETLRVGRLRASCVAANRASARVLEKTGFIYVSTTMLKRPAHGTREMCEIYRLEKPRWEQLVRAGK